MESSDWLHVWLGVDGIVFRITQVVSGRGWYLGLGGGGGGGGEGGGWVGEGACGGFVAPMGVTYANHHHKSNQRPRPTKTLRNLGT